MPRPLKPRTVGLKPEVPVFKPRGVPANKLKTTILTIDEFESIRLADYEGLSHEESASLMNISRPTFSRLIEKARHKISAFLIEANQLLIEGGNVEFDESRGCPSCMKGHLENGKKGKFKCPDLD